MQSISEFNRKKNNLYLFLCGLVLVNAVVAEIVGVKIFSFEASVGLNPLQIPMPGGQNLDINLAAGVLIWPFVFVTSDLINEYFGKAGVRRVSYLTAGFVAYSFVILYASTKLPAAPFWVDVNKGANNFNIDYAYSTVLMQGLGIIIGSISAFILSQLIDAWVFHRLKKATGVEKIWLRATGSTLISQLIDSVVVVFIAFYVFGNWSLQQVINVALVGYIYKFTVAVAMTPFLYLAHNLIDKYLGKEEAHRMAHEALQAA